MHDRIAELDERGWTLLPAVFDPPAVNAMRDALAGAFAAEAANVAVRRRGNDVYAARNVLDVCPAAVSLWRTDGLLELLRGVLGPGCGLVRGLFFDKPPDQTWSLPWHKDLMIAVAEANAPPGYSRPRLRAGVYHTEPPVEVLEGMLTLRLHLDRANIENGALRVLSGSHRTGKRLVMRGFDEQLVTAEAGDVLAIRPLVVHASGRSSPETRRHRRVLHLEFAQSESLPGSVHWRRFVRCGSMT